MVIQMTARVFLSKLAGLLDREATFDKEMYEVQYGSAKYIPN